MTKWLKDIKWEEFIFEKIFDIYSTNSGIDKNKLITNRWNFPYVTRSEKNNWIDFFIGDQDKKYKKDNRNVITIWLDTQTVNYQSYDFYTGQNIQILTNKSINYFNAQFLIPLIKKQMGKFSRGGNGATLTRLKRSKIILPSNTDWQPDYEFMESYMKEKEKNKLENYQKYISKRIPEIEKHKVFWSLKEKDWGEFEMWKLFEIENCKCSNASQLQDGNVPYIGATNRNNGVMKFVKGTDKLISKWNCIAFICDWEWSVWLSIYKKEDFIWSTTVKIWRNKYLNRYIGEFITTVADKNSWKYNFWFKRNGLHLKKEKILLPRDNKGNPDYEYMENYIKRLEYQKLKKYLEIRWYEKPSH